MDVALILAGGRSGSDLLQSLFDNHPQILQFPGILKFDEEFIRIFKLKSADKISKYFIKINKHFFDSRLNKIERHDKLGSNKSSFYKVDKNKFIKNFYKHYSESNKTNFDLLLSLHKAYSKDLKKKKLLIVHVHLFEFLKNYIKIIGINSRLKVLLTLRDPLVSMCSTINNWLKFKKGIYLTPRSLFHNYDVHFNNFNNLHFLRDKIRVVKLENLHLKSLKTLQRICRYLKIKFCKTILHSTYHGKLWWGDSISKKYLKGLNKNFSNKLDNKLFSKEEIIYLESKLFHVIKKYKYPFRSKILQGTQVFYLFPFNVEKKIFFWNLLKFRKYKTALSFLYFYIKRILLMAKKNIFNFYTLPKEI